MYSINRTITERLQNWGKGVGEEGEMIEMGWDGSLGTMGKGVEAMG